MFLQSNIQAKEDVYLILAFTEMTWQNFCLTEGVLTFLWGQRLQI